MPPDDERSRSEDDPVLPPGGGDGVRANQHISFAEHLKRKAINFLTSPSHVAAASMHAVIVAFLLPHAPGA